MKKIPALVLLIGMFGCADPITKWDAAVVLANAICNGSESCVEATISGWCSSPDACEDPIDQEDFLHCLRTARPGYLEPQCWLIFR